MIFILVVITSVFILFADDTNLLYADRDLKSLETVVNNEL